MDKEKMNVLELIKLNTEEVVEESELEELLDSPKDYRAYVGYEPSGAIHMGHVITANKLLDLTKAGFKVVVLLADLHAYLNEKGTFEEIAEITQYNKDCFISLGLDGSGTEYVLGSSYQTKDDYAVNVLQMARYTTLKRARRSMDEVSRNQENPMVSQMIYPLMQAVDIMKLNIRLAVGGIDQRKIHMLAREQLPRLGFPAPICIHTPILAGMDGKKMSSSKGNYISVSDSEDEVRNKIKKAFCTPKVVDDNPVIELFKYHFFRRLPEVIVRRNSSHGGDLQYSLYEELEADYVSGELHPMDLKGTAADLMVEFLEEVDLGLKR